MANHGYCKNCWWWQKFSADDENTSEALKMEFIPSAFCPALKTCYGRCWTRIGDGELVTMTYENNYCPDYSNRKKWNNIFKQTLEDWIKEKFGN